MAYKFLFLVGFFWSMAGHASVIVNNVEYTISGQTFKNVLAYHSFSPGKKPGILLLPESWGLNRDIREKAKKLAQEGYVVMAVDMYGDGKSTDNPKEAEKLMWSLQKNNYKLGHKRFLKALKFLKDHKQVDKQKIGVVGYTHGGAMGVEMASRKIDLKAVVNFRGRLAAKPAPKPKKVLAKILVLLGKDDKQDWAQMEKFLQQSFN